MLGLILDVERLLQIVVGEWSIWLLWDSFVLLDKSHNLFVLRHSDLTFFFIEIVPDVVENLQNLSSELWIYVPLIWLDVWYKDLWLLLWLWLCLLLLRVPVVVNPCLQQLQDLVLLVLVSNAVLHAKVARQRMGFVILVDHDLLSALLSNLYDDFLLHSPL